MNLSRWITALVLAFTISACNSVPKEPPKPLEEPAIFKKLPEKVDSFERQGYRYFEDGSGGFSVRYANVRKRRLADVYIYPVAEQNSQLGHNQLVLGSTRATIQAIGEATRQGHYANFTVLNAATRAKGIRTIARIQATYLRKNLASYTVVYQTEYDGTLIKIRLSMPDNESNRNSVEWDHFADQLFNEVISDLKPTPSSEADST